MGLIGAVWTRAAWVYALIVVCVGVGGAAVVGDAEAATVDVSCLNNGSNGLQSAIDSASSGATIRVRGVCVGNFSIPGAGHATSLTLQGLGAATLNGAGAGRTLSIDGGVVVTVRDLNITGGRAFDGEGGGIGVVSASLNLVGSTVYGNSACYGGGVAFSTSPGSISNSTVRDNLATCADGGGGGGGVEVGFDSSVLIVGTTLSGNSARGGPNDIGAGGALDVFHATATVVGCMVRNNTSGGGGGGISDSFGSMLVLRGTTFRDNQAGVSGGGLFVDGANATVTGSLFTRNTAKFAGGAIINFSDVPEEDVSGNSSLKLDATTITNNRAMIEGGGAIMNYGTTGTNATLSVTSSIITDNTAAAGPGGGLWNVADSGSTAALSLSSTIVSSNTATLGGGIDNSAAFGGKTATVFVGRGTLVTRNVASTNGGGVNNEPSEGATITIAPGAIVLGNRPNDCNGC